MSAELTCPSCRTRFAPNQSAINGWVRCPRCSVSFTPTAQAIQSTPVAAAAPRAMPLVGSHTLQGDAPGSSHIDRGRVSGKRLGVVLGLAGAYLLIGLGLAGYCFAVNKPSKATAAAANETPASPSGPQQQEPDKPLIVVDKEKEARIAEAVQRGVRWLKVNQANANWTGQHAVGYTALPGLTLLECGVPANDPTIQKAAEFVRRQGPTQVMTYDLALSILFLDRLGEFRDRELIQTLALRLVAGQNPTGGWTYKCPILPPDTQQQLYTILQTLHTEDYAEMKKYEPPADQPLPAPLKNLAVLDDLGKLKDEPFKTWQGDNSNTQFAILGLWAARRHDIPMERPAALLVRRYRNSQRPDGSWTYQPGGNVERHWPTMTCVGLLGLAVGHGLENAAQKQPKQVEDPSIEKGLRHLGQYVGPGSAKNAGINLYYMWSIERVGVLYQLKTIEGKDWYNWGADEFLPKQNQAGFWSVPGYPGHNQVIDTCFVLLFLRQANLAKDLTNKLALRGEARR